MSEREQSGPPPNVGRILRQHRERAGYSMRGLSLAAGLNPQAVHRIEKGERGLGIKSIIALGVVLGSQFITEVTLDRDPTRH